MTEALLDHQVPGDVLALWIDVEKQLPRRLAAPLESTGLDWWVSRQAWNARAPLAGINGITPTFGTTIHYAGAGMPADHAQCAAAVRGIQAYHMDHNGWLDIAYSSLGCQHGYVFEGRGAHQRTAANGTNDGNARALAHCLLIGPGDTPTDQALRLAGGMAALYHRQAAGPGINGHRDWLSTDCPGDPAYSALPQIRAYADPPNPKPTPVPQPPEDSTMRDERLITIPAPSSDGKQLVTTDKDGAALAHFSTTSSVAVIAAADGTFTPVKMQWYGYLDALVLTLAAEGGGPAPVGHQARIVIEHR